MSLSSLLLLQLSTRLLSTILTQVLIRLTPPQEFAASHIHLDLVLSTVLFLSREGVRGALLRVKPAHPNTQSASAPHTASTSTSPPTSPRPALDGSAEEWDGAHERRRQNIALLPFYASFLLLPLVYHLYPAHLAPASLLRLPNFRLALLAYLAGAALELSAEPLYTRALSGRVGSQQRHPPAAQTTVDDDSAQDTAKPPPPAAAVARDRKDAPSVSAFRDNLSLRIRGEGAAALSRCILTALVVFLASTTSSENSRHSSASNSSTLIAFALGQTAYGAAILVVHLAWFLQHWGLKRTLSLYIITRQPLSLPASTTTISLAETRDAAKGGQTQWFDMETMALVSAMTRQSLVKHVLTEADRLAITKMGAGLDQQGAYALASNYGESSFLQVILESSASSSCQRVGERTCS